MLGRQQIRRTGQRDDDRAGHLLQRAMLVDARRGRRSHRRHGRLRRQHLRLRAAVGGHRAMLGGDNSVGELGDGKTDGGSTPVTVQ